MTTHEKGSFGKGLMIMSQRGSLVKPVRITKKAKEIILAIIKEDESNTAVIFKEDEEKQYVEYMEAMEWLKYIITKDKRFKTRFNIQIAATLSFWFSDKRFSHCLFSWKDFDIGMQWITNKINKRYSQNEISKYCVGK